MTLDTYQQQGYFEPDTPIEGAMARMSDFTLRTLNKTVILTAENRSQQ
jgi:hypothetical protein